MPTLTCLHCGHEWTRNGEPPAACPGCANYNYYHSERGRPRLPLIFWPWLIAQVPRILQVTCIKCGESFLQTASQKSHGDYSCVLCRSIYDEEYRNLRKRRLARVRARIA